MMATARKGLPLACQCLLGTTVSLSKGIVQARPRRSGFFSPSAPARTSCTRISGRADAFQSASAALSLPNARAGDYR